VIKLCLNRPGSIFLPSLFIAVLGLVTLAGCSAVKTSGTTTSASAASVQTSNGANSIWKGVYTQAQAESGETSYGLHCAYCHGRRLEGLEDFCTPPLQGSEFWRRWGGQSVGALYDRMKSTMPEKQPGSLKDDEYAAIVSFVLKANEVPPGPKDLPTELATLRRIVMSSPSQER
jgi:cytochrome c5